MVPGKKSQGHAIMWLRVLESPVWGRGSPTEIVDLRSGNCILALR